MGKSLVYGIGVNDADYVVKKVINGKQVKCDFYKRWQGMLQRCYSKTAKIKFPSYVDCSISSDWLIFSNFKQWMERQDWNGKELDKDLLVEGNRVYSSEYCVFITQGVNAFLTDRASCRGDHPIGVSFDVVRGKFKSYCRNPFTDKLETIGYFYDDKLAHLAWRKRKNELANQLADLQPDSRVANALRLRYA